MCDSDTFTSHITDKEYNINFPFNCDSSNVVYLTESKVGGVQYVGSTCTPFRLRFNNYKRASVSLSGALRVYLRLIFSGILQGRINMGFSKISE